MTGTVVPACARRVRRGDQGLTTLEWLLIVAAVAALAALAVMLVSDLVGDTAEQISESETRLAAGYAAFVVEDDATAASAGRFATWADWESHFSQQCRLIAVLYGGVAVVHNNFNRATGGGTAFDPIAAAAGDEQPATAAKPQVQCELA